MTWPLLEDDGTPLRTRVAGGGASTAYSGAPDEQYRTLVDLKEGAA